MHLKARCILPYAAAHDSDPFQAETDMLHGMYACHKHIALAGQSNGVQRVWLDGSLVLDRRNVKWRTTSGEGVARFTLRNFMGGSGSDWAASNTQDVVCMPRRVSAYMFSTVNFDHTEICLLLHHSALPVGF